MTTFQPKGNNSKDFVTHSLSLIFIGNRIKHERTFINGFITHLNQPGTYSIVEG